MELEQRIKFRSNRGFPQLTIGKVWTVADTDETLALSWQTVKINVVCK